MNNKLQSLTLIVIVVLAVAVIGLYFRPSTVVVNQPNVGASGKQTGFNCIGYSGFRNADSVQPVLETEECIDGITMGSATSSMYLDNVTGEDRWIMDVKLGITGTDVTADSYVVVVATTSVNRSLGDAVNGTKLVADTFLQNTAAGSGAIAHWIIATGTKATSTSLRSMPSISTPVAGVGPTNIAGQKLYKTGDFRLANNERLVIKVMPFCNFDFVSAGACAFSNAATSTTRTFNLKAWIYSHN